jgi:hypothetical protein
VSELFGVPVSPGAVAGMMTRTAGALGASLDAIRKALAATGVAHFDDTGFRVAGKLAWVHSASSGKFALITVHGKRGREGMDAAGVLPAFVGIAVHDCWAPYQSYGGLAHALCNAHALRELQAVTDAAPQGQWCWAEQAAGAPRAMKRLADASLTADSTLDHMDGEKVAEARLRGNRQRARGCGPAGCRRGWWWSAGPCRSRLGRRRAGAASVVGLRTMPAGERERLETTLTRRWLDLRDHLDERSRRLWLAAEARSLGYGGTALVAAVTKVAKDTISDGIKELAGQAPPAGRVRRAGAGRKRAEQVDPELPAALDALVEPVTRADPESPLRWTAKSLNTLAAELTAQGHPVSDDTVRRLLTEQGFSLQANSKTLEGSRHADRDAQFHHINAAVKAARAADEPVISVDTKKKELSGRTRTAAANTDPAASPSRSTCMTSSTGSWARPSRTGSTTSPPTGSSTSCSALSR